MDRLLSTFSLIGILALAPRCTQVRDDCLGPELNFEAISSALSVRHSTDAFTNLILPNPLDAASPLMPTGEPSLHTQSLLKLPLLDLTTSSRLENSFLKVRVHSVDDSAGNLATPNSDGFYDFEIEEEGYSESLAYFATKTIQNYIEALGFSVDQSRPLYILVRSQQEGQSSNEVNAYYEHNHLAPNSPRVMRLVGDTQYAPGTSRDMYWHEFGHLNNESLTSEVGFDFAGDTGALYTEGSAIHECVADYLAESVSKRAYLGRWIAKNFSEIPDGEPLRYAVDLGSKLMFEEVARQDGQGDLPERYAVAEWCSRVLWEIRQQIVAEEQTVGHIYSDRLIFAAMTLLKQDASLQDFSKALVSADEKLHCGFHTKSIAKAFETRGFEMNPARLGKSLSLTAQPVGLSNDQIGDLVPGQEMAFVARITNTNSVTARNVRIHLESLSEDFYPTTYQQGLGDLAPGQSLSIDSNGGLSIYSSVFGMINSQAQRGKNIRYRLRILTDNGPQTVKEGFFTL